MSYLPIKRILEVRNQAAEALRSAAWELDEAILREKQSFLKQLLGVHPSADSRGESSDGRPVVWFFGGKLSVNFHIRTVLCMPSRNLSVALDYEVYEFDSGKDEHVFCTIEEVQEIINNFQKEN